MPTLPQKTDLSNLLNPITSDITDSTPPSACSRKNADAGKPITVVAVDDDPTIRFLISKVFDKMDNVRLVGLGKNGTEALSLIQQYQPDMIVLDMVMPEIDGMGVIHWIKQNRFEARIAVFSAVNDANVVTRTLMAGADVYCIKGMTVTSLTNFLNEVVEDIRLTQAFEATSSQ